MKLNLVLSWNNATWNGWFCPERTKKSETFGSKKVLLLNGGVGVP